MPPCSSCSSCLPRLGSRSRSAAPDGSERRYMLRSKWLSPGGHRSSQVRGARWTRQLVLPCRCSTRRTARRKCTARRVSNGSLCVSATLRRLHVTSVDRDLSRDHIASVFVPSCLRVFVSSCLRVFVSSCLRVFVSSCHRAVVSPCRRVVVPPCSSCSSCLPRLGSRPRSAAPDGS